MERWDRNLDGERHLLVCSDHLSSVDWQHLSGQAGSAQEAECFQIIMLVQRREGAGTLSEGVSIK